MRWSASTVAPKSFSSMGHVSPTKQGHSMKTTLAAGGRAPRSRARADAPGASPGYGRPARDGVGTNLYNGTVTAVQSTIATAEDVQTANQPLDLRRWTRLFAPRACRRPGGPGGYRRQAEGLSYDIASLQAQIAALFNLDTAPASTPSSRCGWPRFAGSGRRLQLCHAAANAAHHRDQHGRASHPRS